MKLQSIYTKYLVYHVVLLYNDNDNNNNNLK